jgi:cell division septal protein FtsQ
VTVSDRVLGGPRTRAEKVRARRASQQRKFEPLAGKARRKSSRRTRRPRRPRRRLDLAIPSELGAEIRLPAIPSVRSGPRLLSFVLLCVVAYALVAIKGASAFYVTDADVVGAKLLTPDQVRSIARIDRQSIFSVNPSDAVANFSTIAEVSNVRVKVKWPDKVEIDVTERQPAIAWDDGGRKWWISNEGVAFLDHGDWPDLVTVVSDQPVLNISDDPLAKVIPDKILVAASVLSSQLPKGTALRYDPVYGLGFDDPKGWTAYFGVDGDMLMKVRLYKALAAQMADQGIQAEMVSVKDPSTPYYRQ